MIYLDLYGNNSGYDYLDLEEEKGYVIKLNILKILYKCKDNTKINKKLLIQISNSVLSIQLTLDKETLTLKESIKELIKINKTAKQLYIDNKKSFNLIIKKLNKQIPTFKLNIYGSTYITIQNANILLKKHKNIKTVMEIIEHYYKYNNEIITKKIYNIISLSLLNTQLKFKREHCNIKQAINYEKKINTKYYKHNKILYKNIYSYLDNIIKHKIQKYRVIY
jgi:hypothetical protein